MGDAPETIYVLNVWLDWTRGSWTADREEAEVYDAHPFVPADRLRAVEAERDAALAREAKLREAAQTAWAQLNANHSAFQTLGRALAALAATASRPEIERLTAEREARERAEAALRMVQGKLPEITALTRRGFSDGGGIGMSLSLADIDQINAALSRTAQPEGGDG